MDPAAPSHAPASCSPKGRRQHFCRASKLGQGRLQAAGKRRSATRCLLQPHNLHAGHERGPRAGAAPGAQAGAAGQERVWARGKGGVGRPRCGEPQGWSLSRARGGGKTGVTILYRSTSRLHAVFCIRAAAYFPPHAAARTLFGRCLLALFCYLACGAGHTYGFNLPTPCFRTLFPKGCGAGGLPPGGAGHGGWPWVARAAQPLPAALHQSHVRTAPALVQMLRRCSIRASSISR